jgi:hypothetical protein
MSELPYTPADSGREGDPVGHIGDDWGFWDEVWCNWNGGYSNEKEAREALSIYVKEVLYGG